MPTFDDLRRWDADGIGSASTELRADLRALERARDELETKTVPESWHGLASAAAALRQALLVSSMSEHIAGVQHFEREVFRAGASVRAVRSEVEAIDADAQAQELRVAADGSVSDIASPPVLRSRWEAEEWTSTRRMLVAGLAERVRRVVDDAYAVDRALLAARPTSAFSDAGPRGVVDPEVQADWREMTDAERRAALASMAEELADLYGLEDYEMIISDLEDQDGDGVDDDPGSDLHGYWSEDQKEMHLDSTELADPSVINTLAHELRHAAQHENVRDADPGVVDDVLIGAGLKDDPFDPPPGITRDDVEGWDANFDDYQTYADDGWDAYLDQPVEEDAREAGETYLEDLGPEDLDRHRGEQ